MKKVIHPIHCNINYCHAGAFGLQHNCSGCQHLQQNPRRSAANPGGRSPEYSAGCRPGGSPLQQNSVLSTFETTFESIYTQVSPSVVSIQVVDGVHPVQAEGRSRRSVLVSSGTPRATS